MRTILLIAGLLITLTSYSQPKSITDQNSIIGSWKILEIQYIQPDTTVKVNQLDYGRILFTKDRYAIMYNPFMKERIPFSNLSKPEKDEIVQAFRSIVFNSGSYSLANDTITTKADIAKVPGFEGGLQYYQLLQLENTKMLYTLFDETYPDGKKPDWYGKVKVQFLLNKE